LCAPARPVLVGGEIAPHGTWRKVSDINLVVLFHPLDLLPHVIERIFTGLRITCLKISKAFLNS